MGNASAFSRYKHLSELNEDCIVLGTGVVTPAQRRALALANLFKAGDTVSIPGTVNFPNGFTGSLLTTSGIGTPVGNTVATETGDATAHMTSLALTAFAIGNSASAASLGVGAKFYTMPAGNIFIDNITMSGILSCAVATQAQSPIVGVGTVVASGAVAVLSGTATFQNLFTGTARLLATAFADAKAPTFTMLAAASHDMFLNTALAWADASTVPQLFTGIITFRWRPI